MSPIVILLATSFVVLYSVTFILMLYRIDQKRIEENVKENT